MNRDIRIDVHAPGQAKVILGGTDISKGVRAATIRMEAGCIPEVSLELAVFQVQTHADAKVTVAMTSDTRDALIALGWTPPQDAPQ